MCALDDNGETAERLASGSPEGLMFGIGKEKPGGKGDAVIAKDLASAAAIHEATGRRTLCAFGADNLKAVAEAWRLKHPKAGIVVAADNAAAARGRSDAREAAKAVNGKVIVPPPAKEGKTTFGEMWREAARRPEIRRQLAGLSRQAPSRAAESGLGR